MSELVVAVVVAAWVVEAVVLGYVMGRHGYQAGLWVLVAIVAGPFAVLLALSVVLRPPPHDPQLLRAGHRRQGAVDVLVGVDGSPESAAAVDRVLRLFGENARRITLARVIPVDASPTLERQAASELDAATASHPALDPTTVVLRGEPSSALRDYVRALGYDVLVIGTRGAGRSHLPLGSVAISLARGAGIPVLLVDDSPEGRPSASRAAHLTSRH